MEKCLLEVWWVDRTDNLGNRALGSSAMLVVHGSELIKLDRLRQARGSAARSIWFGLS